MKFDRSSREVCRELRYSRKDARRILLVARRAVAMDKIDLGDF